jgi:hypothetical protein
VFSFITVSDTLKYAILEYNLDIIPDSKLWMYSDDALSSRVEFIWTKILSIVCVRRSDDPWITHTGNSFSMSWRWTTGIRLPAGALCSSQQADRHSVPRVKRPKRQTHTDLHLLTRSTVLVAFLYLTTGLVLIRLMLCINITIHFLSLGSHLYLSQ